MPQLRECAFDYVVTVTAPLSGGYVRTQIMIMMQNYDVSNHYSEIESRQLLVMFVTDPFPDGNVMIGDLILGPHWPQKLHEHQSPHRTACAFSE